MARRSPRALLIAEMCNPDWVSVPLVGWSHARALSAVVDSHLVTHARNRENIARVGLVEGRDFTAIETGLDRSILTVTRALGVPFGSNKGWTALTALSTLGYYYFETLLWRRFGAAIQAGEFDIVHRLTPLSPATPSLLARRCARAGVPFVLGPLNGGLPWPKGFSSLRRKEREWLSYVRGAYRLMPAAHATRKHASAILVGSRSTYAEIPARYARKTVYVPENAVEPSRFDCRSVAAPPPPLRVVFVGRFVPYKGADMLLEALAPLARCGRVHVDLIGDGPEMPALRSFVAQEHIAGAVRFTGWVEHRRLQQHLAAGHVFAFPSIREFGGVVVAEAMALGVVPVVVDFGGPGELASPGTGFLLPLGARGQIVDGLRQVFERLLADPSVLGAMSERARRRVARFFTWPAKAAQVSEVYDWVLGRRGKPDFGMPLPDVD